MKACWQVEVLCQSLAITRGAKIPLSTCTSSTDKDCMQTTEAVLALFKEETCHYEPLVCSNGAVRFLIWAKRTRLPISKCKKEVTGTINDECIFKKITTM